MTSAHYISRQTEFDATRNMTKNYHADDSQQIHKYDNVFKNHIKNKHMFLGS